MGCWAAAGLRAASGPEPPGLRLGRAASSPAAVAASAAERGAAIQGRASARSGPHTESCAVEGEDGSVALAPRGRSARGFTAHDLVMRGDASGSLVRLPRPWVPLSFKASACGPAGLLASE